MENSGAVMIEGENYEVVDECIEEEDAATTMQTKSIEYSGDAEKQPEDDKPSNTDVHLQDFVPLNSNAPPEDARPSNIDTTPKYIKPSNTDAPPEDVKSSITKAPPKDVEPSITNAPPKDVELSNTNAPCKDLEPSNTNASFANVKQEKIPLIDLTENVSSDKSNISTNVQSSTSNVEKKCLQKSNTESIDFTADISLDQLDDQKDMTDEDVLQNLDEIENIVLDSSDFQTQDENDQSEEKITVSNSLDKESIPNNGAVKMQHVKIEYNTFCNKDRIGKQEDEAQISVNNDWYEKKLIEKEIIIKERLSKVSRVLGISYPCYEKWLEWSEKVHKSPLCQLTPARRCCLDKPYTNRWKFICSRKRVQESTKKTGDADTSLNKNSEAVWKLEASGAWGVNIKNESEFPPFVLHAVKVFENFLQTTEQPNTQEATNENFSDDVSMEIESKKETKNETKQDWLWLVVRCNSMDELMLFATGKNINRSTMDRLKQIYESGPGKDCNVKSLYCKSINKYDNATVTNTTFLVGSEALDEIVGGLKVQLAPKTNFWSNAAGAENVANAVMDLLAPTLKTTVLEIGCGIGLIGLMMASKCQQVIGVDSPSEVEEAEMTCELNNIKNASFIMGAPFEVTNKIIAAVKNRKTCAVINANTNIGRAIEVMTCLRKIASLKRIVMITTLTKQSVRAILELARPVDHNHGLPFMPIVACVVDTLPVGPHFEAVILLQRRMVNKFNQPWFQKNSEENKASETKATQERIDEQNTNGADKKTPAKVTQLQTKKNFNKSLIKPATKSPKILIKKTLHPKNIENSSIRNKFKGKRPHSPDQVESPPKKLMKKFGKVGTKPWNTDLATKKKKDWTPENPHLRINPIHEKKLREYKEQADLRERLSNNRLDTDIAQKVKEHQALLEIAKEKLSGPTPTVDVNTAKQLQDMLNMVLEQTNKLQSQLPRSVWDRIAPPETVKMEPAENKHDDPLLKGRYVQEVCSQDIVITTENKKFLNNEEQMTKPIYKKYNNLPPLEPNTIMPVSQPSDLSKGGPFRISPERYHDTDVRQQQGPENPWNRDKILEKNRWNEMGNMRKPISPIRRQVSPMKHRMSPPKRFSPKRPLLSPPRRPCSPPRRHFSPLRRPASPLYRQHSPLRRLMSPPRRPTPPQRRNEMMLNRPMSPPRRQISPMRLTMSPPRRQLSPIRRQMSPPRRQIPSPNRMISPNRQEILLPRRQTMPQERQQMSPIRRGGSPHRLPFGRPASSPRRQQSPQRRQMSPQQRSADDWDIPSRGAIEQNTWTRPVERMPEQNIWRSTPKHSWEQTSCNDKRRKTFNQDSTHENAWNNNGSTWDSKQMCTKPMMKDTWSSGSDNRWSNTSAMPGSSNDNWNIRGKESFLPRKEPWADKKPARWESTNVKDSWKQSEKEDLNDLPEDARDPWGDDGNLDLKERWHKFEGTTPSCTWTRENEPKGDTWSKQKDNWQNKGLSFGTKPQWQNNGLQNVGESRWMSQNNTEKKIPSSTWQSGNNVGSWQSQNSNFPSRNFSTTQFKRLH